MTKQRKFTLIWLLLPLLFLRGLVPTGFMIDVSGGSLSMVICSGSMSKPADGEHAEHAAGQHEHHHQGNHHEGGPVHHDQSGGEHRGQQSHGDSICPFAAAATAAPTPSVLPMLVGALSVVGSAPNDVAKFDSPFGPSRAQQSRAPPFFS